MADYSVLLSQWQLTMKPLLQPTLGFHPRRFPFQGSAVRIAYRRCDNIAFFLLFRRSPLPLVTPTTSLCFRFHLCSLSDPLVPFPALYDSCLVLWTLSDVP